MSAPLTKVGVFLLLLAMVSPVRAQSLDRSTERLAARVLPVTVTVVIKEKDGTVLGSGSGFVVAKNRIATNLHVVAEAVKTPGSRVTVRFANGQSKAVAGVGGVDALSDVALLVVDTGAVHPLPFGKATTIGQAVMAVGSPRGLGGSVSTGIVSTRRAYQGVEILQITTPISPGSSGGVLVDGAGNVVGITSFFLRDSQNINFAYGASRIAELLKHNSGAPLAWASLAQKLSGGLANTEEASTTGKLSFNDAYGRGCKRLAQKRYADAAKYLRLAVQLKPTSADAHKNLAECLSQLGKSDEAIKEATEAAKLKGNSDSYWDLGDLYAGANRTADAIAAYEKSSALLEKEAGVSPFEHTYNEYQLGWSLARNYYEAKQINNALEKYRDCYSKIEALRAGAAAKTKAVSKDEADTRLYVPQTVASFLQEFSDILVSQFGDGNTGVSKEEVLEVCTEATACKSGDGDLQLLYGYALYINDKKAQAISEWESAAKSSDKKVREQALKYLVNCYDPSTTP